MRDFGRALGNIQSRIDYACYKLGLPPLGLIAEAPFKRAWNQGERSWAYPVNDMRKAAKTHVWTAADFQSILAITKTLPGAASTLWKNVPSDDAKAWASGFAAGQSGLDDSKNATNRNDAWSRDELILALDLYLRFRKSPPSKTSSEIRELSNFLGEMGRALGRTSRADYRNTNGVYMKIMNFRRFDPNYLAEGKIGLTRGNKYEKVVWDEYAGHPKQLVETALKIRSKFEAENISGNSGGELPKVEAPYWVLVCNPKKWNIDGFFDRNIEHDTWGIRPADKSKFSPGQLAIVRVGVDTRSAAQRKGKPKLTPGIYAICEVESAPFPGSGANDEFWSVGEGRTPGWPTIKIRYLQRFQKNPLTIERLKQARPALSPLLLNGFQGATFPISTRDFQTVSKLLNFGADDIPAISEHPVVTPEQIRALEMKYRNANPEVKTRLSRTIERGNVGTLMKQVADYKCQICKAKGVKPISFAKKNGDLYVEAHHVMPVSKKAAGSLAASNIMILCANHHRQVHYGDVQIEISSKTFDMVIDGSPLKIQRLASVAT